MKRIAIQSLLILVPFLLSCCSKDSPEDENYCLDPAYKVSLEVEVNVDGAFRDYLTVDSFGYKTRSDDIEPYLKYYVAAYPMTSGLPTVVSSSTEGKLSMRIHPGRYTMVGWVMYETDNKIHGYNFYDDDLSELLLKNKYNYTGADPYKVAFRCAEAKNIAYNTTSTSLTAKPSMARYRIIATDTAKFKPVKVLVRYTSPLPAAIHAKTGEINWWWTDISYTSDITEVKDLGDQLAEDFVLSQDGRQTTMNATVEIYDEEDRIRARKKNVMIPLTNGGITTVTGRFYSVLELDEDASSGSGISIKTEWDATFEIEL